MSSTPGQLRLAFIIDAIDNATAKVRVVNKAVEAAGEPVRRLRASTRALFQEAGWDRLKNQWGAIRERGGALMGTLGGIAGAAGAAGLAAGGAFFALKRTIDEIDRAGDTAKKLGMGVEQLQRMQYASQLNGSSAEAMGGALQFLSQNMVEAINGSKEAAVWFERAGIPLARLKQMNSAQVFEAIADQFVRVGDAGQNAEKKIALMRALMGRSGAELKQVLELGSKGLRQFYAEADRLGAVIDGDTASAMADFNDNFDRLGFTVRGVMATIARYALPHMDAMVRKFTDMGVAGRQALGERLGAMFGRFISAVPGFVSAVGQVATTMAGLAVAGDRVAQAMGGWENVLTAIGVLLATKVVVDIIALGMAVAKAVPILIGLVKVLGGIAAGFAGVMAWPVALVAALVGAALLVWKYWEPIKKLFTGVWDVMARIGKGFAGTKITYKPTDDAPSIYAGKEEWAAYRAKQAGAGFTDPALRGAAAGGSLTAGGTLRITLDSDGKPRATDMRPMPGSFMDFDVYAGAGGLQP